ncbi:hypothetical protein GCM10011519_07560 [Marmoricola endophyticus]|uniref:Uncharacterized protein n=1 Tax=Marmoricola endophyticus TaxID=2040280 RepID=A0A917F1U3_9ACTN|nr:hypothetical protein [Marmoricola endophyticus]GGF36507.1 hypothetical protein GCM10011519_07560 [Marmoricola endophyticus]
MANVTLPTPVLLAGGALCLVGGYLLGAVTGPDTPDRTTATVVSYQRDDSRLCLRGEAVEDQRGAEDGELCGVWRRSNPATRDDPKAGEEFRFVTQEVSGQEGDQGSGSSTVVIYGDLIG